MVADRHIPGKVWGRGVGVRAVSNALRNTGSVDLTIHATTAYGDIASSSL
jgi:hypothetical protein